MSGVRDDAFMPADVATSTAYTFAGEGRVRANVGGVMTILRQPYFAPVGGGASARSTIFMYLRTDTFVGTSGAPSNLDLSPGTTVPVGGYDETRGLWGPEPDGTYVGVTSAATNCINVGGAPVTVPSAEMTAVCNASSAFPDNSRYMRVPISHFSPTDWNLLGALANFLENIQMDEPSGGVCETTANASIIYCERRALGERIPVHGTPFELSYNSANQAGRTEAYSARVTAGGTGAVPATVNLSMEVAGRTVATASVALGGTATLTWDGNDAFGRRMLGPQRADIWVEYVFNTEFLCQNPSTPGRSFQDRLAGFTVNCGAREARLRYRRTRWVGNFDDRLRGLGGWAISDHHIYDPVTRVLSMGTGEIRTEAATGWVASADTTSFPSRWGIASAAAADGTVYFVTSGTAGSSGNQIRRYSPSGALDATTISVFSDVTALAVGPEGEVYVGREGPAGTANDGCIMRLRSWTNSTAAFEPLIGTCGTASTSSPAARSPLLCEACGTPAAGPNQVVTARVHIPTNLAVSPEGILAYTDRGSGLFVDQLLFYREVSGTRMLSLFRTSSPELGPVVFDRQSRMYWSVRTSVGGPWVVRRLDDDADPGGGGVISDGRIVLGGGSNLVDGVPATGASGFSLDSLLGLAVLPTGELIAVQGTRVRMVGLDQRVRTIAGCAPSGACTAPTSTAKAGRRTTVSANTSASGRTQTIALTPSGTLLFGSGSGLPLLTLQPALPPMGSATTRIPSTDATLVYEFDADGRHLFTRDAITNTQLIAFTYDATGRLQTVADAEGVAVNVAYPTDQITLTAPGPNVTTITISASTGYANSLLSGGLNWTVNMGVSGLMTSFLAPGDPASHVFTYDPDGSGRLSTDVDLTDAGGTGGRTVTVSTPQEGASRLFRQRNSAPASSIQFDHRWQTVTDPSSPRAGAWQRTTDAFRVSGLTTATGVQSANPRTVFTQYPEEVRVDQQILSGTTYTSQVNPGATIQELGTTRTELAADPRFDMEAPYAARVRFCTSSTACNESTSGSWTSTDEMVVETTRTFSAGTLTDTSTLLNASNETSVRTIASQAYGQLVTLNPPGTGYPDTQVYTNTSGLVRAIQIPGQHPVCIDYTGRRVSAIRQGAYTISSGVCTGSPTTTRSVTYTYDPVRRWRTGMTTGVTQTTTITPNAARGWPEQVALPARSASDPVLISYFNSGNLQYIEGPGRSSAGRYNYTYNGRNLFNTETTPLGTEISATTYNFAEARAGQSLLGGGSVNVTAFDAAGLAQTIVATQGASSDTWSVLYDGAERPTSISHTAAAYGSRTGALTIAYNGPLLSSVAWGTTPGPSSTVAFGYETRTMRLDTETVTNESTNAVVDYAYSPNSLGSTSAAVSGTFSRNATASLPFTLSVAVPTASGTPLTYPTTTLTVNASTATATTARATQFGETYESVTGTTASPWFIERICSRDGHGRVTGRNEWVRTGTNQYQQTRYVYSYVGAGRLGIVQRYQNLNVAAPVAGACPTSGGTLVTGSSRAWTYNDAGIRSDLTAGTDDQVSTGGRQYDVRGRLSKSGGTSTPPYRTYTHDVQGRLRQSVFTNALFSTTTTTFEYDPLGRLSHIDPDGTPDSADDEYFWYRDGLRPIAWQRGQGTTAVHAFFVYLTRSNVPDLMYVDNTGTTAIDEVWRLVTDERGSVRVVLRVDGTPSIVQRISYDEWGVETVEFGASTLQPFGFAGGIRMATTALWHFGARNYSPAIGQWVEKDPIEYAGGTGPYLYCENDPVNFVDPSGRVAFLANPIVIGALTGGIASFIISVGIHAMDGSLCGDGGAILDDTAMGIVSGALFAWALPFSTGLGSALFGRGPAARVFGGAVAGAGSNVATTALTDALGSDPDAHAYAGSALWGVVGGVGSVALAEGVLGRAPPAFTWGPGTGETGRVLAQEAAAYGLASQLYGFLGGAPGNLPSE
jgi:RHS repeat-associated protein